MGEEVRDRAGEEVCGEERPAELNPENGPEDADCQFDERVAEADPGVTLAAAAAEDEPAQEGQVFPPGQGVGAAAAVGAGCGDAFAMGPAGDYDVEEAAEGEAEEGGEEDADELETIKNRFLLLC